MAVDGRSRVAGVALNGAFPEIGLFAAGCRYHDCRHEDEPGCAVRESVPAARLKSFRKLLREASREQTTSSSAVASMRSGGSGRATTASACR